MGVRLNDGIEITLTDGTRVVCDANHPDGDINVISHAHGDHFYSTPPDEVVSSALTLDLATARREDPPEATPTIVDDSRVRQMPAGHVAGSMATYIDDGEMTYCYTGDCSLRSRFYLDGFDPEPADVLVIEATYGKPEYRFPPEDVLDDQIVRALQDASEENPLILFGYSLGRAQKLQLLADKAGLECYATTAIRRVNGVIEDHIEIEFPVDPYTKETNLEPGMALIAPSQSSRSAWVESVVDATGAQKFGFSGWAVDSSFKFRGDYDEAFILSDHADIADLEAIVEAVEPDQIFTNHGFVDELSQHLTQLGWNARSLKRNQSSLADF